MGDSAILVLGGAFGFLAARLVSIFALPLALHLFTQTKGLGLPLSVTEKQTREHLVRRIYHLGFPLVVGVLCAFTTVRMFGSGE